MKSMRWPVWLVAMTLAVAACGGENAPAPPPPASPAPAPAPAPVLAPASTPADVGESESKPQSTEVIGRWQYSLFTGFSATITILRDTGAPVIDTSYSDGSGGTQEIVEGAVSGQRRFEETEGNDFGEYDVIDAQGNLKIYDQEGLIRMAAKVRP